jgi:cellulose synthase/poly-beta-1,6-N-acetylglucosamine synthase-like glycosyltransferase
MDKVMFIVLMVSGFLLLLIMVYPLIAYFRAKYFPKQIQQSEDFVQPVSILISAYNEGKYIRKKIAYFLSKEEWIEGSELIVVSPGSSDETNAILMDFEHVSGFTAVILDQNIPKTEALNMAVKLAKNELLIFSDCRQIISFGAVKKLVSYFNDPTIGTVNSTILDKNEKGSSSIIRKWLNKVCLFDSVSGSSLNIHGALYAQRKSLFRDFPSNILFDDLYAVVSTLTQGKRLIQSKEVTIIDVSLYQYYTKNRLERLTRGMLIFLVRYWREIKQLSFGTFLRFFIYRYLKLFLPFIILGSIIPLIYFIFRQGCFEIVWILLGVGIIVVSIHPLRRLFVMFMKINYSFLIAILKFLFLNDRETKWDKLTDKQKVMEHNE